MFLAQVIVLLFSGVLPFFYQWKDSQKPVPRVAVAMFSWPSHGLSFIERNLKKWVPVYDKDKQQ